MASKTNDIPQNDEISLLLDKMYEQLMMMRIKLMEARRSKATDLAEQQSAIEDLNYDYNEMLKNHTSYWKYKKAMGHTQVNHSESLKAKLKALDSNMGTIVSIIPSN